MMNDFVWYAGEVFTISVSVLLVLVLAIIFIAEMRRRK